MNGARAMAAAVEALATNGYFVGGKIRWLISRFTDGWMISKAYHPDEPFLEQLIGGVPRVILLDDGDANIVGGSQPPTSYIKEFSKTTRGLGWWSSGGYFEFGADEYGTELRPESFRVPVVYGSRDGSDPLVNLEQALLLAKQKAESLKWPKPQEQGLRFNDGWLLRSDEQPQWDKTPAVKRFVVLDNGKVHTEQNSQNGSYFVRKYSTTQNNLRLWYPDGYIDIRPDGTNHWVHTNKTNPIEIWAGPQHD